MSEIEDIEQGFEDDQRIAGRNKTRIKVVVKGRESIDIFWKEVSETENVSKLGANFTLKRECHPGKILSLMMKMPKNFRSYDWDKKLYPVWAIVQFCTPITRTGENGFQVGVAFVGKNAPKSYLEDPNKIYQISGMDEEGFWNIEEAKTPFVYRVHPRYPHSLKARLALIDSAGDEIEIDDEALTKDVSVGGTAVYSNLQVNVGDSIKFTCQDLDFTSVSLVRNRQMIEGEPYMLHLSFSESKFPIDELSQV